LQAARTLAKGRRLAVKAKAAQYASVDNGALAFRDLSAGVYRPVTTSEGNMDDDQSFSTVRIFFEKLKSYLDPKSNTGAVEVTHKFIAVYKLIKADWKN